ncbi:MAG: hypothetical protein C4533_05450 [Candidatus Omnitrophota bacterium]|jgi:two-component system nitrogen regulation response regulator GlnG|nr:MAG: hypothetical protein C4533_05450 [Candidatus Omnitrophota bacterium]
MIKIYIADNEEKIKSILSELINEKGNFRFEISKKENIFQIMEKDLNNIESNPTLESKVVELENSLYREKKGVLYKSVLQVIEKPLIEAVLERTEGNQLKAARILGINRNTMRSKIKKLGIIVEKLKGY